MAWRDTLNGLRDELAEVRAERQHQTRAIEAEQQRQREELSKLADTLGVSQLLNEMNSVLLRGEGKVEILPSWENGEEDEELPLLLDNFEDEEGGDVLSSVLTWEEDGEREIAVDLGFADQGPFLQVNEIDTRPEQQALEQALVEAFREELEL
jgi:hypothetical protein